MRPSLDDNSFSKTLGNGVKNSTEDVLQKFIPPITAVEFVDETEELLTNNELGRILKKNYG